MAERCSHGVLHEVLRRSRGQATTCGGKRQGGAATSPPVRSADARGAGDLPHPPALEVAKRLDELLLAVHHEGPVVRHALAQRLSREEQQPRLAAAQPDGVTGPELGELPFGHLALTHARRALEYVSERILIARDRDGNVCA